MNYSARIKRFYSFNESSTYTKHLQDYFYLFVLCIYVTMITIWFLSFFFPWGTEACVPHAYIISASHSLHSFPFQTLPPAAPMSSPSPPQSLSSTSSPAFGGNANSSGSSSASSAKSRLSRPEDVASSSDAAVDDRRHLELSATVVSSQHWDTWNIIKRKKDFPVWKATVQCRTCPDDIVDKKGGFDSTMKIFFPPSFISSIWVHRINRGNCAERG